jgi:NarL family two-component system response regulator LiaR
MASNPQIYQAYLLRFWRRGAAQPWRVTLQYVGLEQRHHFASVGEAVTLCNKPTGSGGTGLARRQRTGVDQEEDYVINRRELPMEPATAIRVMLVDDHPLVANGLKFSLQLAPGIELVGEAANGQEAVRLCAERRPDVILMDVMLPELDGIAATAIILKQCPQIKVLMLSALDNETFVQQAIRAGACGYLLKTIKPLEPVAAIRLAYAGQFILAPAAMRVLLVQPAAEPRSSLTRQERQILALLVQGLNNEAIAARLVISLSTVRFISPISSPSSAQPTAPKPPPWR